MRSFRSFISLRGRGAGACERVRSSSTQERRKFQLRGVKAWSFEELEVRRGLVMRGGKWFPRAWLLLCFMLCCVLSLWAVNGSGSYSPDLKFSWMSRAERDNEAENLDEISIALLKLGLPLSAYALTMQNARAQSALVPTDGLLASGNASTGFRIAEESNGRDIHPLETGVEKEKFHGSNLMTDSWAENVSGSELSIYSVASAYKYVQQMWVFRSVCYNGSHLIRLQSESCREPEDAAPHGLLTPLHCSNGDLYARRLAMVGKETGIPMADRSQSWVTARDSIVWRNETVAVVNLDRHTTDPTRFLQKVNMLLLLNNASSTVAFLERVEMFMFMSHHHVAKILKHQRYGEERFHNSYLSSILSRAVPMDEKEVGDIFHGRRRAADSRVQLNDPFSAATEESPLCFRKAVLTGTLKGSCWPGGEAVADIVRGHLSEKFETKPMTRASEEWPCLVSILGNNSRATLPSSSEEGFQALLNKKSMGLEVHLRDLSALDFKQQFDLVQIADITTGFYGPDLYVPATFCRKMTILVEIIPFKVQDRAHETQALDSGLIYMAHHCDEGIPQDDDSMFQNLTASACMMNSKCKHHYSTVRKIQLTNNDLSRLRKLFTLARLISSEIRAQKLVNRRNIHDASSSLIENLIGAGRRKCKPFDPADVPSASCGNKWISFTSKSQGPVTCCY